MVRRMLSILCARESVVNKVDQNLWENEVIGEENLEVCTVHDRGNE